MSITIKEVAKEAGVSISTVSKVINKSPTISQETAKRVEDVMKKLHYYPNLRAKNFAQKSTKNIIFMTRLQKDVAFMNPHMFEIMCGAQKTLAAKGYNLSVLSIDSDAEPADEAEKIIAQKSADGLIIHGSATSKGLSLLLPGLNFPHIIIGKPDFESQLCWIDTNNCLSGEIATNHLCNCGYQNIAFLCGHEEDQISAHRLQGFLNVMKEKELTPVCVRYTDSSKDASCVVMSEVLSGEKMPDAVICENNSIALGSLKAIHDFGLRIPEDIGVITFDNYPFSMIMDPPPTVVNIDVYDMGLQAASMLIRKIKNPSLQVQIYTTLPELIVRGSTVNI
jgi:DNA-binding LacI/PurR family transcriptional regulator